MPLKAACTLRRNRSIETGFIRSHRQLAVVPVGP